MEERGKVRRAVPGHLPLVPPVGVHHEDLQLARLDEVPSQQFPVARQFGRIGRMVRPVHDPLAVRREERPAVVARHRRQALHIRAIQPHGINLQVAVADRGEDDARAVRRDRRFGVVAGRRRQPNEVLAADGRRVDVVIVQGPEVPALGRRLGRALRTLGVRGREEHPPVPGQEIAAGGGAPTRADHPHVASVQSHHVLLVAAAPVPRGLKNQGLPVEGEIGLGVLPAVRELADIAQMLLGLGAGRRAVHVTRRFIAARDHRAVLEDQVAVPSIEEQEARDRLHRLRRETVEHGDDMRGIVRVPEGQQQRHPAPLIVFVPDSKPIRPERHAGRQTAGRPRKGRPRARPSQ